MRIERGGGAMEERYIRELDPKEQDPGVEAVIDIMQHLFPSARVEKLTTKKDNKVEETGELITFFGGEAAIVADVTSETKRGARESKMEKMRNKPFASTAYSEHDLPRVLVYVDPSVTKEFLADHSVDKHPDLSLQILESYKLSLIHDLGRTQDKDDQKRINQWLALIETKIQELKKSGKPNMRMH